MRSGSGKLKRYAWLALAGAVAAVLACAPRTNAAPKGTAAAVADASEREALCLSFVEAHLTADDGGIRTNYLDKAPDAALATGAQVLSESMGLLMRYAAAAGERALFERSLAFVEERLDTGEILSYRYSQKDGAYPVNAFLDDLRIIRALLEGYDAFGGEYQKTALEYAGRLYRTNVAGGRVYDYYDEHYGAGTESVTLCYLDLGTLRRLAELDGRWQPVFDEMRTVALGGYLGDRFPMFARSYTYADGAYADRDIDTVQSLLTMLHLSEIGECPQSSVDFVRRLVERGTLYGAYDTGGGSIGQVESTAIYAISACIGRSEGDEELYRASMEQMERFQVLDRESEVYGAFADAQTLELYAFDNLTALLAFRG